MKFDVSLCKRRIFSPLTISPVILVLFFLGVRQPAAYYKGHVDEGAGGKPAQQYGLTHSVFHITPSLSTNQTDETVEAGIMMTKEEAQAVVQACATTPLRNIMDFYNYPNQTLYPCRNKRRMGGAVNKGPGNVNVLDGDKWMCADPGLAPNPQHCIVYSFGIDNEWSFDDAMAHYGCQVWSFDPTMGVQDHQRSTNIAFLNLGLGDAPDSITIMGKPATVDHLGGIMKKLNHSGKRLDYLKMDIEGMELKVLEHLLGHQPHLLTFVTQLGIEVHPGAYHGEILTRKNNPFNRLWRIFQKLHCLGFRLLHWNQNYANVNRYIWKGNRQSACYEVVWVKPPGSLPK